jgi:hypothetical protein
MTEINAGRMDERRVETRFLSPFRNEELTKNKIITFHTPSVELQLNPNDNSWVLRAEGNGK